MNKITKIILAKEGLILIAVGLYAFIFGNIIASPFSREQDIRRVFIIIFFSYLILRFVVWAIKILKEERYK